MSSSDTTYPPELLFLISKYLPAQTLVELLPVCKEFYHQSLPRIWKHISLCPPKLVPEGKENGLGFPGQANFPESNFISPKINTNITNSNSSDEFLAALSSGIVSSKAIACIETFELAPRYLYQRPSAVQALKLLSSGKLGKLTSLRAVQINLGCDRFKVSKAAKPILRDETSQLMDVAMRFVADLLRHSKPGVQVTIQACYPMNFESCFASPLVCNAVTELGITFYDSEATHTQLAAALTRLSNLRILNIKTYNVDTKLPVLHHYQAPLRALSKLEQLGLASGSILNGFHPIHFPSNLRVLSLVITPYYGPNIQLWKRLWARDLPRLESLSFSHFDTELFTSAEIEICKLTTLKKLLVGKTPLGPGKAWEKILATNKDLRIIECRPDKEMILVAANSCKKLEAVGVGSRENLQELEEGLDGDVARLLK